MKTIALAVAALVSGAAFAQSNVTLYGRVDLGYAYSKSDFKKFQGIEQGQSYGGGGSHIGVKGEEALGNGLKAVFRLETAVTADETGNWENARFSYVGLAGKFGTVTLGKDENPSSRYLGATGALGINGYVPINLFRNAMGSVIGGTRWGNAITYLSPNFSGFDFAAIYSFGEKVSASKDNNGRCSFVPGRAASSTQTPVVDDNGKRIGSFTTTTRAIADTYSKCADTSDAARFGLGVRYANGPLYLTAVYQAQLDDDSAQTWDGNNWQPGGSYYGAKSWSLGGAYDFKVVKLYANYFRVKANHNGLASGVDNVGSDKRTAWSLGVSIPVSSAGTVAFDYARYKDYYGGVGVARAVPHLLAAGEDAGHKAKGYSLGYRHNLSKRTHLYTYVSRIDNDRGIDTSVRTPSTNVAGEKQTNFTAGIVHLF